MLEDVRVGFKAVFQGVVDIAYKTDVGRNNER